MQNIKNKLKVRKNKRKTNPKTSQEFRWLSKRNKRRGDVEKYKIDIESAAVTSINWRERQEKLYEI